MKNIVFTLCVSFCLSAFPAFLAAQVVGNAQQKFDITTYKIGKDFKAENVNANTMQFTKTNSKTNGYCVITLSNAKQVNGSAIDDFKTMWNKAITQTLNAPLPADADIKSEQQKDGRTMVTTAATVKIEEADNVVILVNSTGANNFVSIMIVTNTNEFEKDIANFVNSLQFANDKGVIKNTATAANPTPNTTTASTSKSYALFTNNGIEGVWVGYGNAGLLTDRPKWNFRIFFGDGNSLIGMPDKGLNQFNYTTDAKQYTSTYNYTSGSGKIIYGNNKQFKDEIKYNSALVLFIDGVEYRKCVTINNVKINGTYSAYLPTDNTINRLPEGEKPRITFTKNGKFTDEGLGVSFLKDFSKDDAYNKGGIGSYEIINFSVILKYDDGRVKQFSLIVPASKTLDNTDRIVMERGNFYKVK